MSWDQWLILAMLATPLLVLARDAFNRRHQPREVLLALGVFAAILINVAVTLGLRR